MSPFSSDAHVPKLVAGLSVLAVVLVLGIVWLLGSSLVEKRAAAKRHRRVRVLCKRVAHTDKILTMSAKTYAATGDTKWLKRYDAQVTKADSAIEEIEALASSGAPPLAAQTSAVEARLIEMKQEAFRLAATGTLPEAMAILESDRYERAKQEYSRLTQAWCGAMLADAKALLAREKWESSSVIALAVAAMLLILGSCFVSLTVMRRHLIRLKRTEDALREAHGQLERRVEERTAELAAANEELQRGEETARALVNAAMETAFLMELDGTLVTLNETAAKRLGGTVAELVGKCVYDLMPPEVAEFRKRQRDAVVRTGKPHRVEDKRAGRVYDGRGYPVFDSAGKVVRIAVFAQDVTERKVAEETLEKERQRLKQLLESSDRERKLMSYEIHDGLAQQLTATLMQFQAFERLRRQSPDEATTAYAEGSRMLQESIAETRRLISGLRPPIIDEMGLVSAVEYLVSEQKTPGGPEIELSPDASIGRLDPALENALFRIIQESLANACQHSRSERVRIELTKRDGSARVVVQDWGIGFDPHDLKERGFGLDGIQERARLFGGHATIDSAPGKGTRVVAELPLQLAEPDGQTGPA